MALTLLGLALSAACSSYGAAPGGAAYPLGIQQHGGRPASGSASQYIKNVIVIIQENRSFEDFFAGYPGANAPLSGCASPTPASDFRSSPVRRPLRPLTASSPSPCPSGDTVVPLHEVTFENNPDGRHDWYSSIVDWNNGNMDGFTAFGGTNGVDAEYAYMNHAQIAPYWTIAQQYVLADEMFPTEFGGSFTAHLTLVAGTDDLKLPSVAEVNFPNAVPDDCDSPPQTKSSYVTEKPYRQLHLFQGPFPCFDQFNTIAEVLDNSEVSWKYYATQVLDAGLWEPFEAMKYVRYGPDWYSNIIAPQTRILTDPGNGQLAQVSWVTPSHDDSDHPAWKSDMGPSWVASVINAIGQSKYWPQSAIVVVWDDWGGFYDSAPPPQLDYRGLGIRVPCLIISPYAKQGYISNVQYEFGSILRFIEEVNGIPPGAIGPVSEGYTDGRATSLDDAFNFTQSPRPFQPISAKYPASVFLHEKPSTLPVDTE